MFQALLWEGGVGTGFGSGVVVGQGFLGSGVVMVFACGVGMIETDEDVVFDLKSNVDGELERTSRVLTRLRDVEKRKIFLKFGYASLFEFCLKELRYAEGSALRRIAAMRLLKEIPEIESQIRLGSLSLSVVSQAQSFFKRQDRKGKPLSREQKVKLLDGLENKSARECEAKLLQLDPHDIRTDHERRVNDELVEIRMTVTHDFMEKVEKLKNILSHARPFADTKEILEFALDELIERKDPARGSFADAPVPPTSVVGGDGRVIKLNRAIRREVWKRCEGQCCFIDPVSGRRCLAKRYLEIDHIQPRSKMGSNDPTNLQLLCSAHNKLKSDL